MLRRVVVGSVVTISLLVPLFAAPARAGGGGCGAPVTDAKRTQVRMKGWCFGPTIVHIRKGAEVTWVNRDRDRHNVAGANYLWGSRTLRYGDEVTYKFKQTGTYPYVCQYHYGMIGAVVVGNGKAQEAVSWRDKAVKQTSFERKEDKPASVPGGRDHEPPAGKPQPQVDALPEVPRQGWPAEWFVVLSAAVLACVGAVLLALRRGPRPYATD